MFLLGLFSSNFSKPENALLVIIETKQGDSEKHPYGNGEDVEEDYSLTSFLNEKCIPHTIQWKVYGSFGR